MNYILSLFVFCFFNFVHINSHHAQDVVGLWEFTSVTVGANVMTPVAKWTRINQDFTYESGNGWTQNSVGHWSFDVLKNEIIPLNTNGIKDEFGPFKVSFRNEIMEWKRDEEGMTVLVQMKRIKKLPAAPADLILGLWDLETVRKNGIEATQEFDPDDQYYVFFRPDGRFRIRNEKGNIHSGFLHMDGHQPELTLIYDDRNSAFVEWKVTVDDHHLTLTSLKKDNQLLILKFVRIRNFPE